MDSQKALERLTEIYDLRIKALKNNQKIYFVDLAKEINSIKSELCDIVFKSPSTIIDYDI